jgi:hypothetical protein
VAGLVEGLDGDGSAICSKLLFFNEKNTYGRKEYLGTKRILWDESVPWAMVDVKRYQRFMSNKNRR